MMKRFPHWTLAAALALAPSLAYAQFGGFTPQTYSTQATVNAVSDAAQNVRGARQVINEAVALSATHMAVAEAQNRLALALADGGVSLWNLELGREVRRINAGPVTALAFSSDGKTLATGSADGAVDLWDADRGKRRVSLAAGDAVRGLALSADDSLVQIDTDTGSRVMSTKGGKDVLRLAGPAAFHPSQPLIAAADGTGIALSAVGAAQPLWRADGTAARLAFSPDGTVVVAADKDGAIQIIDATSGRVIATAKAGFAPTALSVGFATALVGGTTEIRLVDLASGAVGLAIKPHAKPIADALLLRGGALVLTASTDASIRLTDPKAAAEPLGQMVVGRNGWAVVAASGEFDAENDGLDAVKWAAGQDSFTLDQFSDNHFQPGILPRLLTRGESEWRRAVVVTATRVAEQRAEEAKLAAAETAAREKAAQERLATEKVAKQIAEQKRLAAENAARDKAEQERLALESRKAEEAQRLAEDQARQAVADAARVAEDARKAEAAKTVVVSKEFAMPPQVAFETPKAETSSDSDDFQLNFNVKDLGGGVEEVRLYQNGKLVSSQAGADNPSGFTAKLAQGPNEFRLVALSRDRIESRPAKVKVTYTGAERKSTLHVVAIGINKYKNPALNLNYGVGDAQGIADYFGKQPKTLYKDVVIHTLYDDQATKANIVTLLASLKDTKPEDSVVIYLAGHGDTLSEGWYFMPTEVRYPEREDEVRERGLAATEINVRIKEMGAQKILMLVDACKSGAALVAFRGFEDRKALMQVARSSGVHVVAAAGKDQFAAELAQLGHGLFTYTLLDGLSGKADRKQAHVVTVRGLTGYVEDQLPEISQAYKGVAQFPVVDSRGMDFPVATY